MLTVEKALFLVETFSKAPQLFHSQAISANTDPGAPQKKCRRNSSSPISSLAESYPYTTFQELLKEYGEVWRLTPCSFLAHWNTKHDDVLVRLYIDVERIDKSNSAIKLVRRTLCVALTELHEKRSNIDDVVSRVCSSKDLNGRKQDDVQKKFYDIFKAGTQWKQIMGICAKAETPDQDENVSDRVFSGILWLLGTGSVWERVSADLCTNAKADLGERTDLFTESRKLSPAVNAVLDNLKANVSFSSPSYSSPLRNGLQPLEIDASGQTHPPDRLTRTLVTNTNQSIKPKSIRGRRQVAIKRRSHSTTAKTLRPIFVTPDTSPSDWKAQSEAAASKAAPCLQGCNSSEIPLLLVLLCFFGGSQITKEPLWRGSTRQKRWSQLGEMIEMGAFETGLHHDLGAILSDYSGLSQSFRKLEALHVIGAVPSNGMTMLDQQIVARVTDGLPRAIKTFWMHQALLIASHGFPRKYLEPKYREVAKMQIPHLQHTLKEFGDRESLEILSDAAKADLILSLLEASRFSNLEWKLHAITLAKTALQELDDSYLHACVAGRDCAIFRILGNTEHSTLALSSFAAANREHEVTPRMNAELGQLTLQSAISHIHNEELAKAIEELQTWHPLSETSASKAERIVLFHMNEWREKALRYQGRFSDSLAYLHRALLESKHEGSLEDAQARSNCNLGDVYCELGEPLYAERLLNEEIKRLADRGRKNSTDWYLLQLSLAESLLGQSRLDEAEALCSEIQPYPRLSKINKLRLFTLFGRIYHLRSDWSNARQYWTKALVEISAYPLVNGHTSKVILKSMKEVLLQEGNLQWSTRYKDQINEMEVIKPGGCEYWIPGLGRWHHYLTRPSERL